VINNIQVLCGIESIESPTIIYEDNATYIAQMQSGYAKSNVTKHITPNLFYPHELQVYGEISIMQTKSCNNLADLFTKSLQYCIFYKRVTGIGMRRLRDLQDFGELYHKAILQLSITLHSFPYVGFGLNSFFTIGFNETISM
jgi:hypothetical protein